MDSQQQQISGTEAPAVSPKVAGPVVPTAMAVRLWACGGPQRKLRDFSWKPEGAIGEVLGSLVQEGSGTMLESRQNLLTVCFDHPVQALSAAKALQQKLQALTPGPDAEHILAAIAIYPQSADKTPKRKATDSSTSTILRRPLRESDLPQILVTEEIYKQIQLKGVPDFQFSAEPRRHAGGSRARELMYGLLWTDEPTYTAVRQTVYEASLPRFSRYAISSELGRGTMGVVYKAHDKSIDRMVALKTISLNSNSADLEESVERLRQEAKAAGNLDHPNIITIYDVGEEDGFFYLSMQFVEGKPLSELMAGGRPLPLATVLSYVDQICNAVGFAHKRGIVHRDLKPSNMMLTSQGTVKVLDFGIAKLGNASMTQTGMVVGTPSYMSPEQAMGRKVDQRSDIFSLGAVFYELLTGKRPFHAQDVTSVLYKVVHQDPTPPAAVDSTIPIGIDSIVRRALQKVPQDRFQNCEEMREAFRTQALLVGPGAGLRNPTPRPLLTTESMKAAPPITTTTRARAVPQKRRPSSAWAAVFSLLAGAALVAGFWAGRMKLKARAEAAQQVSLAKATPKSDVAASGAVVPETKTPADENKTQPGAEMSAAGTQPVPLSTSGTEGKPAVIVPAVSTAPAGSVAPPSGVASTASADTAKTPAEPADANPFKPPVKAVKPAPKPANNATIEGFTRKDIPALLRKADAAAGKGEYTVAKYEYNVILKLDRQNAGALAGLRRVTAAEKEKLK